MDSMFVSVEDTEVKPMLDFEADDTSRPPAPPVDDFPVGCEVELVDAFRAKEYQTAEFWEPAMDQLFAIVRSSRQEVTVVRHSGDYTFVRLVADPELTIGCHLHRACLKEPKVKFRRYVDLASDPGPQLQVRDPSLLSAHASGPDERTAKLFLKATSRGNKAFKNKLYQEAASYYSTAFALNVTAAEKVRALANRSAAFLALREYTPALDDALACLRYDPKEVSGYCRAGNVYRVMRQFERAEEMYSAALRLQPRNDQIRLMQISNAASSYFRSRTLNLRIEVNMTTFESFTVTSRTNAAVDRYLFSEKPVYAVGIPQTGQATARGDLHWCSHCQHTLVQKQQILDHIASPEAKAFAQRYYQEDLEISPCLKGCPATYCSDSCRNAAWKQYHCVECTAGGRWAGGVERLDNWLRHSPLPAASRVHIFLALRILSTLAAVVRGPNETLKEAVQDLLRFFPRQPQDQMAEMVLVTPCFEALSGSFSTDEARSLTFPFFSRCYFTTKRSAIGFVCGNWSRFQETVDTHLQLLLSGVRGGNEASSSKVAALREIAALDPATVPGVTVRCAGLFEILSLCTPATPALPGNVALKVTTDTLHPIQVTAIAPIVKGAELVLDAFA